MKEAVMEDPQLSEMEHNVRSEIERADHLSSEQKEIMILDMIAALKCMNGAVDKIPHIAKVVALSSLRHIQFKVRFADDMASAISKALSSLKDDLPEIISAVMREHTASCPMSSFDPRQFVDDVREELVDEVKKLFKDLEDRMTKKRPQTPKTWGELAKKIVNDLAEQYPVLIGISLILFLFRYGMEGVMTVGKLFGGN
jgi:hypothetical protein